MTLRPSSPATLAAAVALAAALAAACSAAKPVVAARQAAQSAPPPPRIVEESTSGTLIRMNPATAAHFHLVRTRAVEIAHRFSAPGAVASDVSRTVTVYSLANGFAVQVPVELGDKVTAGQVLAVVNSPDLARAISVYQTAKAEETLDDKQLAREQKLFQHGATPRAAVETAQFADQHARIEVTAAKSQIRLLGGNPASASALVQVRAPIGGTIIKQNISRGEAVENNFLFRIADLSRVWVLCSIYENQLARVRVGDQASLKLAAYPKLKLRGRILDISRILNSATRTATVRVVLNNPRGLLMPGMFATARFTSRRASLHILVPVTAIFELHNQDWLFRPAGPGVFRRVPVTVGTVDTPGWETVTRGIRAGQPVVANAFGFAAAVAAGKQ
jgi:cobalt-zinc-cadmium efflux system membrane fusion protein